MFLGFHSSPLTLLTCNTSPQTGQSVQHWASHQKCFKTRYFRQPNTSDFIHKTVFWCWWFSYSLFSNFCTEKWTRYWISEGWAGENSPEEAPRQRNICSVLNSKKAHVYTCAAACLCCYRGGRQKFYLEAQIPIQFFFYIFTLYSAVSS